jgi:hypothetical protein
LYEKKTRIPIPSACDEKPRKKKAPDGPPPADDYDPTDSTIVGDMLVLGVDPGRTQIVTIVCITSDKKRHVWRLSRGQYYTEGGILGENKKQARRYKVMEPYFAQVLLDGGSLRTDNSGDLKKYLAWYRVAEKQWWAVALRKAESRGAMQRYIAKKSVMAKFWSKVHKDANVLLAAEALFTQGKGPTKIDVAYGSAAMSMPCTGKGEVAAPVGAAHAACKLEFGKSNVTKEWEYNTTKISFETRKIKELVYKMFDRTGKEFLHHTPCKRPPLVPDPDLDIVKKVVECRRLKAQRRRGGRDQPGPEVEKRGLERQEELRYPECRGLRFCTESSMYYDRDEASGRAIAGLRCLKLRGLGRPTAFCATRQGSGAVLRDAAA